MTDAERIGKWIGEELVRRDNENPRYLRGNGQPPHEDDRIQISETADGVVIVLVKERK